MHRSPAKSKARNPAICTSLGAFLCHPEHVFLPAAGLQGEKRVCRKYFQNTFAFLARAFSSRGNKEGTGKLGIFLKITTLCPLAKMAPRMS